MSNYIILNGVNSNTITGLLISQLPPVSKPKIRTEVEEIDGRDGDIITTLGYAAYDKTIEIGLYGDFDINEVIAFFNSEGTITFSNEPDNYYNYQILDQIDFERLIRFRTATVTIHCQPFKYSTTDEEVALNGTIITGEGTDLNLVNTEDGGSFIDLELKGQTEQQTYSGKNLFDKANANVFNGFINGDVLKTSNDTRIIYISCKSNTTYTIQKENEGTQNRFCVFTTNETIANNVSILNYVGSKTGANNNQYLTITTPSGAKYLGVFCYISTDTLTLEEVLNTIQIEEGSTATSYEPYVGGTPSPNPLYPQEINVVTGNNTITISNEDSSQTQTYPINLGTLELCKINVFQDYIYQENGTWYKHSEIGKTTDTSGSTSITINAMLSDGDIYSYYGGTVNNQTITYDSAISDTNTIYYQLETSTETEITDTNLISQLEALYAANTYLSETNIITSGDLQPIIYVQTYSLENPVMSITNSGNINSKPIMTIYGQGNINLYLNGEQVFTIALGDNGYITIDIANMEASQDGVLMNRLVTGNYNDFALIPGENEITFTGTLQAMTIENYSRWV